MRNNADVRTLLSVCEKIKSQGQIIGEKGSQLDGITCQESYDGYSITLADDNVSLDINFHNTYHFHTANEDPEGVINQTTTDFHSNNETQIQAFMKKLVILDETY
ncbi:DUF3081 domain-containing protein [Photobacterium swingsii]|uniref:DUF3081 domain-containing protein n=1 Tax=Photobacterium swingsii TaxID=680026 RepID=A0A0J8VBF1_9GAMM|nr:DUF3081 family protein [Photobacterium swingsii]KMV30412.1 hypothetical protein AB733_12155 [Photobacterium swingsii]PSW24412.1 DUF3081 domain-containing protein [Photobacterium swingsii]